jgi:hypothetical protein
MLGVCFLEFDIGCHRCPQRMKLCPSSDRKDISKLSIAAPVTAHAGKPRS